MSMLIYQLLVDSLPFRRMSKSSCSSCLRFHVEKKAYKPRLGYSKQWEVQYSLGVLYRCLLCKLGQPCIPWKEDLKESFSIEVQYFNTHSYTIWLQL